MASLPLIKVLDPAVNQLETRWKSQLDPLISNPINGVSILKGITLINGVSVINHMLGRVQQGWFITDISGNAQIFRSAPFNSLTLTLTSNAAVTVDIGVY